mgnify:CR=1 FL=1
MTKRTIVSAVKRIIEDRPIWINGVTDKHALRYIDTYLGNTGNVYIDLNKDAYLPQVYIAFQKAQISFYSNNNL